MKPNAYSAMQYYPKLKLLLAARGYILVVSVLMMGIILLRGTAAGFLGLTNVSIAKNIETNLETRYRAEAGVDAAIAYLETSAASFLANAEIHGNRYSINSQATLPMLNGSIAMTALPVSTVFVGGGLAPCPAATICQETVNINSRAELKVFAVGTKISELTTNQEADVHDDDIRDYADPEYSFGYILSRDQIKL